jgi:hypothetical protein
MGQRTPPRIGGSLDRDLTSARHIASRCCPRVPPGTPAHGQIGGLHRLPESDRGLGHMEVSA